MKIEKFDKTNLRIIREAMERALASVSAEYGIGFTFKAMRFDERSFRMSVECVILGGAPDARTATDRDSFQRFGPMYNLTESDYKRQFNLRGDTYSLVAIKPDSRKYPYVGQRLRDGKHFKFRIRDLAQAGMPVPRWSSAHIEST